MKKLVFFSLILLSFSALAQKSPMYPSYKGLVMCGYQGWFKADGDTHGKAWGHYGHNGKFDPEHLTIDIYPDMREYKKQYPTDFINADGSTANIFSSSDQSTTDLHFKWMKDYQIDGAFMQRFFSYIKNDQAKIRPDLVIKHAFNSSQQHDRAIAIMYDLSGLKAGKDDCSTVIEDWKHLVDDLNVLNKGKKQTYLHHNGKPLVAIWGVGFPDRAYDIDQIKLQELIDFLKNDPVYGGCSVMLGIPTYFRELKTDCSNDPYLHKIIEQVDVVLPWMVGRFNNDTFKNPTQYHNHVAADIEWCASKGVDYVPCVYPGFSWANLRRTVKKMEVPYAEIPRQKGAFFWNQIYHTLDAGAEMLYVAMFDEVDESTAIFKCTDNPPVNAKFIDMEGMPSDHYLKLTQQAGKVLRGEAQLSESTYKMK
ncbi:glycoside hydrolase family 71/99-like protein [Persicobacter psychrovividus]|uniref:Xylosidase n=1 Tax=Persicobacter psychrovividus TaxID=387638 RepID=A0ABN6LFS3_9BACT|nr:hypothetical protein PEPS_43000 [Persicobacter psychrovividus]